MKLTDAQRREAAAALIAAERDRKWIEPITFAYEGADIEDAYHIAMEVTAMKVASGRRIKGHKIGLTSKAMRAASNATEPDYGTLFDDWFLPEGSIIPMERFNRPRVEAEIAFVLKHDLVGPSVNTADVIRATDFVLPCLEIVDSRFSRRGAGGVVDTISDAASCGVVILGGNPRRLDQIDIRRIGASLAKNGDIEVSGVASAVMANPINSVAWLANKLHEFGVTMAAGHVILSGSFIAAIPFEAGDTLTALFDQLGEVTCSFQ
jgi:2-keto-4-pentenoate hydratase